jgi:hypothetical protein
VHDGLVLQYPNDGGSGWEGDNGDVWVTTGTGSGPTI